MQGVLSFLEGFADSLVTLVNFIITCFADVIYMIQLLVKVVAQIPNYFSWLPAEMLTLVIVIFGVVVVYKILGREG